VTMCKVKIDSRTISIPNQEFAFEVIYGVDTTLSAREVHLKVFDTNMGNEGPGNICDRV
jgi:hypothetical protein